MIKNLLAAACLPLLAIAALFACMDHGEAAEAESTLLLQGESRRQQEYRLPLEKGAYLIGRLDAKQGHAALWLLDDDGNQQRLLADTALGELRFHLRVPVDSPRVMVCPSAGNVSYQLLREAYWVETDVLQQAPPKESYSSHRIEALAELVEQGRLDDAYWSSLIAAGTPLVEPLDDGNYVLSFIYRGAQRNVRLLGAPSGDHDELLKLGNSDIWYRSYRVPADTRLSYKLAPDVPTFDGTSRQQRVAILATARADPNNQFPWPKLAVDPWHQFSTVELPKAPIQPGINDEEPPKGGLTRLTFDSQVLNESREVYLFQSEGFRRNAPNQLLMVLFDGRDYLRKIDTPSMLSQLISEARLPPMAVVLVDNPSPEHRARQLPSDPLFAQFVAEELLPWSQSQLGSEIPPERRVIAGSSYGGLAATRIALAYPNSFGNVLSMSASHWWQPPGAPEEQPVYLARAVINGPRKPLRFFMSAGSFERSHAGVAGIVDSNRHFRDVLLAKGYPVYYREYAGGHDYLVWQGALGDGLIALFSGLSP